MVNVEEPEPTNAISPRPRFVVLGASNISRSLPAIVQAAENHAGGPMELVIAAGHGRSFGLRTTFLGRSLPGILQSGIWSALGSQPRTACQAIVTDVGNDLFYGVTVTELMSWVDECLDRLRGSMDQLAVALPPVCNLEGLAPWRFYVFRRLFFPRCPLTLPDMARLGHELEERLREVAQRHATRIVEPERSWYGVDPLHIKRAAMANAWQRIFGGTKPPTKTSAPLWTSLRREWYLKRLSPERKERWGREWHTPQPAGRLPHGTTIALY